VRIITPAGPQPASFSPNPDRSMKISPEQRIAALRFAESFLKKERGKAEVPVGDTDLSRICMVLRFPVGAALSRSEGSEGDGYDACPPNAAKIIMQAALLVLTAAEAGDAITIALWRTALRQVLEDDIKVDDFLPECAMKALAEIRPMQPGCTAKKKTPATPLGIAAVDLAIERVSLKDHKALDGAVLARKKTPSKKRILAVRRA
jgi:hypothetical protein